MQTRHKQYPRFELALALLTTTLGLPAGAAGGIYTLGRIAGWIAHVSEQRLAGFLIRPRARFTGSEGG
jgi:citrate synthase